MILWYLAPSIVAVHEIFRSRGLDYRLIALGALLPLLVDLPFGYFAYGHSLFVAVGVLAVVMLATIGRPRLLRRRLICIPIGWMCGLVLSGAWVTVAVRCAPPTNKPTPVERDRCTGYLVRELRLLKHVRSVVALGAFGWDGFLRAARELGHDTKPRPAFGHGATAAVGPYRLFGSYHVSQQNTFTGRLTEAMLDAVFTSAARV